MLRFVRMVANVADWGLVLEYNDDGAEKGFQCPREATYVTEPIEKGVDFSSDNFSVTIQLVSYR